MTATPSQRDALLRAAERLIAERGLHDLSLRQVNAAAGARNASAVQYHFDDRAGLIRAVLGKHEPEVEAARHRLLDDWEAAGGADLRSLVAAFVRPLAAELDCDGGPGYLQLMADLLNAPHPAVDVSVQDDPSNSTTRWRSAIAPLLEPGAVGRHRRFVMIRFTVSELARRARVEDRTDHRLFTSDLVDLVTGLAAAPVSTETSSATRLGS